jgi:Cu2+-containing amine oxidase
MKSKEEIIQLAKEEYWMFTEQYERGAFVNGYSKCQEDITNEIQSLIDGYKSYILRLEEKFKDTCSALTLEKIVTLESIVENLESKLNK